MGRPREYFLEAKITKLLERGTPMRSPAIAEALGCPIDTLRLALMDLSYQKQVHRSNSGNYRLTPPTEHTKEAPRVSPLGEKAKTPRRKPVRDAGLASRGPW